MQDMRNISPYLLFNGQAQEAFDFYKSVFGGEFGMVQKFKETPEEDRKRGGIKDEEGEKLMHISLPVGRFVLMASDAPESRMVDMGNNISIALETDSREEADTVFKALSEGGEVTMPLGDTFWGAYYAMLIDKFGISWMVSYTYPRK